MLWLRELQSILGHEAALGSPLPIPEGMERFCSSVQQPKRSSFPPHSPKKKCFLNVAFLNGARALAKLHRALTEGCSTCLHPPPPKATPAQPADPPPRPNLEWRAAPMSKKADLEGTDSF